jgi:hypothetical protein
VISIRYPREIQNLFSKIQFHMAFPFTAERLHVRSFVINISKIFIMRIRGRREKIILSVFVLPKEIIVKEYLTFLISNLLQAIEIVS